VVRFNQASLLSAAVQGAVQVNTNGPQITATFTPNFGLSLQQAAAFGGYIGFDWVQVVTSLPSPNPFVSAATGLPLVAPFFDPPPGGYTFQARSPDFAYPFVYTAGNRILDDYNVFWQTLGGYALHFDDTPADSCLSGGSGKDCAGATAPPGSGPVFFRTDLVGILPNLTPGPSLFQFDWESNFNGTVGGTSVLQSSLPVDPGSGTGGATLLSEEYLLGPGVPEPGTWVMMIIGFASIGFRWNRKMLLSASA